MHFFPFPLHTVVGGHSFERNSYSPICFFVWGLSTILINNNWHLRVMKHKIFVDPYTESHSQDVHKFQYRILLTRILKMFRILVQNHVHKDSKDVYEYQYRIMFTRFYEYQYRILTTSIHRMFINISPESYLHGFKGCKWIQVQNPIHMDSEDVSEYQRILFIRIQKMLINTSTESYLKGFKRCFWITVQNPIH